ncbi:uncharacterized protein TRUGW13939_11470 [Talaromyces rugulosus]|uniref:Rhodopsin domain-containing protein n=1 Tax=Talaromyces rugulosus TaxID=121627 RepID=A0A7H8RDJ3_TALRU|nr:uncharacterized protein TRUGW13939_11470 [Talaromyces rugulosus]QKX64296.1 hypothetical protein TRUGW13939_11470 [Talaromyces rugulosus]
MAHGHASAAACMAVIWTLTALSTLFIAARLYTRLRIVNTIGLDDYIMSASLICCYVYAGLISASVYWGMFLHMDQLSSVQKANAIFYSSASFTPGILSFIVPKLGVTALLIRILNPTRQFKWVLWILVGASNLLIFGCVIIMYAQCTPAKATWTLGITDAVCWSPSVLEVYSIVAAALSGSVDLFLAIYPATVLWKLQMNRKKKIGLSITLGLGVIACGVSIVKATRLTGLLDKSDYTYSSAEIFLWTSIEANTIIQGACVPTIAPLVESVLGRRILYSHYAGRSSSYLGAGSGARKGSYNTGSSARKPSIPTSQKWPSATASNSHNRMSDIESQRSICDDEIPLANITRKDEFSIQYEPATEQGLDNVRDGRPPAAWRKSFLKYGPPP